MKSQLLESIGLGNIDIAYILIGLLILILILFILLIVSMVKQSKLKKRYEAFMQGSDAKTMEKKSVIFTRDWKLFSRRSVL